MITISTGERNSRDAFGLLLCLTERKTEEMK